MKCNIIRTRMTKCFKLSRIKKNVHVNVIPRFNAVISVGCIVHWLECPDPPPIAGISYSCLEVETASSVAQVTN